MADHLSTAMVRLLACSILLLTMHTLETSLICILLSASRDVHF